VGPPELEVLKAVLANNARWAGWCTIAVFLGLLVEYTILLWLKRKDLTRTDITLTIVAGVAISLGVGGEYLFGSRASDAAMSLEGISERRVADLNREAGDARQKAGEANERAAKADLARSQLEARLAWRRVSKEQMLEVATALKPFKGRKVRMGIWDGNKEAEQFRDDLVLTFKQSGISDEDLGNNIHLGPSFPPFSITSGDKSMAFAQAIVSAFKAAGIIISSDATTVGKQGPGIDEVNIYISRKSYP